MRFYVCKGFFSLFCVYSFNEFSLTKIAYHGKLYSLMGLILVDFGSLVRFNEKKDQFDTKYPFP